jgi:hypothetical protein
MRGLNTIHANPDETDFQLTAVRGPGGAVATIRCIGRKWMALAGDAIGKK